MKKITLSTLIASTTLLLATNAAANPWRDCGIGAAIFSNNGTAAVLSNVIWDLGTTAVTSKISSQSSCGGRGFNAALFIQDNYNQVIEETSQGSGAHLTAMLNILEIEESQQPQVIKTIRSEMAGQVIANKSTPENYYNVVMSSL